MSQVTIYLEEDVLAAAKDAAARAQLSVSKWFAQFAIAEQAKSRMSLRHFLDELDRTDAAGSDALDFALEPSQRYQGIAPDRPLESI